MSRRPVRAAIARGILAATLLAVGPVATARADFESARKHFAENVRSADWKARRGAYGALADHDGAPAATAILAAVVLEAHPVVLQAATAALASMRSEAARAVVIASSQKGKGSERLVAAMALGTMRGADVDAALVAATTSPAPQTAALAAAALGLAGRAGATDALVRALAADAVPVRCAAARSLAALGDRAATKPLVARLAVERFQARAEVVAALEAVTRERLGDAPAKWAAVAAGEDASTVRESAAVPPTFFGLPVTAERVVFVLDRSLQMADPHAFAEEGKRERLEALCTPKDGERIPWRQLKTRLQLAVAQLRHAVAGLPAGTKLEVVIFAEDVQAVFGRKLTPVSAAARKTLDEALAKVETDDGIAVYDALLAALDVAGPQEEKAIRGGPEQVFLVLNNVATKGEVTEADLIERGIGFRARSRGVRLSVIDLGKNRIPLGEGLAKATSGTYLDLTR